MMKRIYLSAIQRERQLLEMLDVQGRLDTLCANTVGLVAFAEAFYFVRVNFVQHNFLIGGRCAQNEVYWEGLARNLMEELGGQNGVPHNELYRRFLASVGARSESRLVEPGFAQRYNETWTNRCKDGDVLSTLCAIGIFEALDGPDYQLLLDTLTKCGVNREGLEFFEVHAQAEHFACFNRLWQRLEETGQLTPVCEEATQFVLSQQSSMWQGLLSFMEGRVNGR